MKCEVLLSAVVIHFFFFLEVVIHIVDSEFWLAFPVDIGMKLTELS